MLQPVTVYIVSVQYLCVCSLYMRMFILCACNVWPRRAFVLCNFLRPHSMFFDETFFLYFCRTFAPALPFPFRLFVRFALCVPLAVPFPSNVCNVRTMRFQGYFKRLFPFVSTFDHLKRFVRLHSLVLPYFAVLCGVWGGETPKGKGREAQLRSHRILYFLFPKFFSGKFPLSSLFMLSLSCQNSPFP